MSGSWLQSEYWNKVRENAHVAFAFDDKGFWLYFALLALVGSIGLIANDELVVGAAGGAAIGAVTGRASTTN